MFEFVQIQCNYLDWTLQDARRKYDIITSHGLGVWIMEPLRGGKLAALSEENSAKLKQFDADASDASYSFRFLQDLEGIKVILSGMNEVFQVEDNLKSFESRKPLSEEERKVLFEIADSMKNGVPCTACRYCCKGCPMELDIPMLLDCYNNMKFASSLNMSMRLDGLAEDKKPSACIGCGQCTHACPQGIDVPSVLRELDDIYTNGPTWAEAARSRHDAILKDLGK